MTAATTATAATTVIVAPINDSSNVGPARYRAVAAGVIRREAYVDSEKVGKLREDRTTNGTVRVHFGLWMGKRGRCKRQGVVYKTGMTFAVQ